MTERSKGRGIALSKEDPIAQLVVAFNGTNYEILQFSSVIKFVPTIEKICNKCYRVTKGDYVQVADKIIDIRNKDHDWILWPKLKEKIMKSPVLLKRLNELLMDKGKEESLRKFLRTGVCEGCLKKTTNI